MRYAVHLVVLSIMMLFFSCGKSGKCADVIEQGNANANSSYEDFSSNADLGQLNAENKVSISFTDATEDCFMNSLLTIRNLEIEVNDTIVLETSPSLSSSFKDPTAIYYILTGDITPIETYILLDSTNINNWLLIDDINADSSEITGKFNMSFVTKNEKILSGERERSDDPNRPDTLHFFDGEFLAVRNN